MNLHATFNHLTYEHTAALRDQKELKFNTCTSDIRCASQDFTTL